MRSQSPREAHFFRFPKGRPQAGQTFDSRTAAVSGAAVSGASVPGAAAPRPPPLPLSRCLPTGPVQSPCVPRTCFQNFVKLGNAVAGIG